MLLRKDGVLASKTTTRAAKEAKTQLFKERNAGDSEISCSSSKVVQAIPSLNNVLKDNIVPKCMRRATDNTEYRLRSLSIELEIQGGHLQTQQETDINEDWQLLTLTQRKLTKTPNTVTLKPFLLRKCL